MLFILGKSRKELDMNYRKIRNFILLYYNSLSICLISLWLAYTLIKVNHPITGGFLIAVVIIKLIGMWQQNAHLRKVGIIGLNAVWAVSSYVFISDSHPVVELSPAYPLFILLIGVGLALRGSFDER